MKYITLLYVSAMGDGADGIGALAESVFADCCPPETVRTLMGRREGYDRELWRRWAEEPGVQGVGVPERFGGAGLQLPDVAEVFEAAGRTLVCAPLLSTAGLAIPLLLADGDEAASARWLPGLADGSLVGTVVTPDTARVRATSSPGGGCTLDGEAGQVVDGASADLLLVAAETPDGAGVFAIEAAGALGLTRTPLMSLDLTRRLAALEFRAVPAVRVAGCTAERLEDALDTGRILLAAELVGVAQHCLDMTVRYTSERIQFGRPVGSFQAIKQRAADLLTRLELARSAARHAAEALPGADRRMSAALAKAYCAETAVSVAAEAIQLHGGIGFTWEHDAHLYYKRALTGSELLGSGASQWARVTAHLDHAL
jgi:acyl-CoA dehydrogenase